MGRIIDRGFRRFVRRPPPSGYLFWGCLAWIYYVFPCFLFYLDTKKSYRITGNGIREEWCRIKVGYLLTVCLGVAWPGSYVYLLLFSSSDTSIGNKIYRECIRKAGHRVLISSKVSCQLFTVGCAMFGWGLTYMCFHFPF